MKKCKTCGESLPLENFNINRKAKDLKQSSCRRCSKEFSASYYRDNKSSWPRIKGTKVSWMQMRSRCLNKQHPKYMLWGGRGITVCEQWNTYEKFLKDMGERPVGYSIDRIDVNGDYTPLNCRWATNTEQCNNKRNNVLLSFNGESKTLAEWSRITGVKIGTIWLRNKMGMNVEDILFNGNLQKRDKLYRGRVK